MVWDEEVMDGTGQTADGIRKVVRMDFRKASLPSVVPSVRQSACLIGGRVGAQQVFG